MVPATRSQTTIVRKLGVGLIMGTDEDYMKMYTESRKKEKEILLCALKCTRRCLYCGGAFSRERHPRPSLAPPDGSARLNPVFEAHLHAKTGRHLATFLELVREAKEACRELEKVVRVCRAFQTMGERQCVFCCKRCRSSPFEYRPRLIHDTVKLQVCRKRSSVVSVDRARKNYSRVTHATNGCLVPGTV